MVQSTQGVSEFWWKGKVERRPGGFDATIFGKVESVDILRSVGYKVTA
jgi:hypothetical protein